MPRVEKSIVINMPPEEVFEFISGKPERMPDWWPPLVEQERVTPPPTQIGSVSRYVYKMVTTFKGEHVVEAMTPNEHLRIKTTSGIDSMFDFSFAPEGESATHLTVVVEYTTPGGVFGKIAEKAGIERKNEQDWETGLQNLKALLESGG
jgi:uncharacterized protein YndB with AHSA1/START domain